MADRVGQQLGNYKLIKLLGVGGFAEVYLGEHIYLKTQAAIKLFQTRLTSEDMQGFLNEARTIANLRHNNIVRVLEFGVEQDSPYLVMDYAPHGTLRQLYPRGTRLSLATILPFIKQIASALQYVHDQKLVHRDVKPENFLLGEYDEVLLSDFGIATAAPNSRSIDTSANVVAGTISYMAPEQMQGKSRSTIDQYALGAVVYEWLCGRPPFQGSFLEVSAQHLHALPPSLRKQVPEISSATEIVVLTALAKDPQQRFASVSAFASALEQAHQLENPSQSFDKIIVPNAPAPSSSSTIVRPIIPSISSIREGEQSSAQPVSPPDSIEHIPTILIPSNTSEGIAKTFYGPPTTSVDKCSVCGAAIRPGDAFCLNCGARVTSPSEFASPQEDFIRTVTSANNLPLSPAPSPALPSPPPSLEKCPFCQAETRPGDNFCLNCGNRLLPAAPSPPMGEATLPPPDDWAIPNEVDWLRAGGTIADRFEPTFATIAPSEEAERSILAPPPPISMDSYPGLSLDQIKEQLFTEGDEYYRVRRYKEALNAYQRIIQIDAKDVRAHGNKGNALGRLGRYKEALEAYTTALSIDANHPSIWSAKGDMLVKERNYQEALVAYNQALTLNSKDALTWKTKGNLLSKLRNYNEALVAYDAALALKPKDAILWAIKGNLLYKLGRYDDALVAYTCSVDIAPKKAATWEAKGDVLSKLRRYGEALAAYERGDILNPRNPDLIHKCETHRELKRRQDELAQPQTSELGTQIIQPIAQSYPPSRRRSRPLRPKASERQEKAGDETQIVEGYDVFLSYSEKDAPWVEELARRLEDEGGFQVWMDKWLLVPGKPWIPAKAEAIEQARSCVVCIGEETPISWFEQEIEKAVNRQRNDPNFSVIPILLPTAKILLSSTENDDIKAKMKNFLELNTWVDFRKSEYDYAFHVLVSGIQGKPPGRWPPEESYFISAETKAQRKLRQLRQFMLEGIVDKDIVVEYQRQVLTKIWLDTEDDTNE